MGKISLKNIFTSTKRRETISPFTPALSIPPQRSPLPVLLIIGLGLLIYSNTFSVPFYYDDVPNIAKNPQIRNLNNFWPPEGSRWFGFFTFAVNYRLGGLDVTGYHFLNIAIHILNAILVYYLFIITYQTPLFEGRPANEKISYSSFIPLFIALLFVSHPIQTQAVTYIIQRFTSLATMFFLLSLVSFIKSRLLITGFKHYLFYAISLISAILAMKTKELSFTLPIIMLLYEFMFFQGKVGTRILRLAPLLLTLLIIPLSVIGMNSSVGGFLGNIGTVTRVQTSMSRLDYLFTEFRVIVTYIRLLLLPINQNLDYDYPIYNSFLNPEVFLSFLFLLAILSLGAYLVFCSKFRFTEDTGRYRLISFGIFWFFLTLSIESSIIPISDVIYEHRLYLPSIGFFLAVISGIELIRKNSLSKAILYVMVLVVISLSTSAYARNSVWRDKIRFWEDVVGKSPHKGRPYTSLGHSYSEQNRNDEALMAYQTAVRLNPNDDQAHHNLGDMYLYQGRIDEAAAEFKAAIKINPYDAYAHYNLGTFYIDWGRLDEAVKELQAAIKLSPYSPYAHYHLGSIFLKQTRTDEAVNEFLFALMLKPDYLEASKDLKNAYELRRRR